MSDEPLSEALDQVRRMQDLVGDRLRFKGFSARARIAGGFIAMLGALALIALNRPHEPWLHLAGWALVLLAAGGVNYGALLLWLLDGGRVRRRADWIPALESLPPLAVGGAFSLAFVRAGLFDLLPATWMLCYGLAHMAFRRNLPLGVYLVGFFYLAAGFACLLLPGATFTDPRPLGFVFGFGEAAGGYALLQRDATGAPS
jgi:hypothetical protein